MKPISVCRPILALLVLAGVWLAGCAEERTPRFGVVSGHDLRIGDHAPDFSFAGENGKVDTFGHVRQVVTIVVFPDDPTWPDCSRCSEIVQLAAKARTGVTPISVVSIATPARGSNECAAAVHRCAVKSPSQLIALHDHTGRIRSLYGSQAAGKYYVVGWMGRITAIGPLSDRAGMEKAVRDAVEGHQKQWDETARPPYGQ